MLKALKKYNTQFVRIVHPDILRSSALSDGQLRGNMESLQNLNSIVSGLALESSDQRRPMRSSVNLKFFIDSGKAINRTIDGTSSYNLTALNGWKYDTIRSLFELYQDAGVAVDGNLLAMPGDIPQKYRISADTHIRREFQSLLNCDKSIDSVKDMPFKERLQLIHDCQTIFYHSGLDNRQRAEIMVQLADSLLTLTAKNIVYDRKLKRLRWRPLLFSPNADGFRCRDPFLVIPVPFDTRDFLIHLERHNHPSNVAGC